jgi:hypothetical protein
LTAAAGEREQPEGGEYDRSAIVPLEEVGLRALSTLARKLLRAGK